MTRLVLRIDQDLPAAPPLAIRVVAPTPDNDSAQKWAAWQERGRVRDRAFEQRLVRVGAVAGALAMIWLAWFVFR